ncbi:MAG: T9SS type A sorting domain-containing protein [Ignavibacteriae bacterium]|nr:T9SS type A sorting domain-containing protein [Ignavibacteriota bacterium]
MKTLVRFLASANLFAALAMGVALGQETGDYRSAVNGGNWGTVATWERYDGAAWIAATTTPGASNNVTIRNGFNVVVEASAKNCKNLTIESGATLATGLSLPTSSIRYVRINGTSAVFNGSFGNPVAPGDAVALESANNGGTVTISGSGTFAPSRVRVNSAVALGSTIVFDMNTSFFYTGSSGTGGVALYPQVDNCTFTLNAGRTMTFADQGSVSLGSSVNAPVTQNCTFNINGTMDLSQPNCQLTLRAGTGKAATLYVGGTGSVLVGRHLNTTTVADAGTTVMVIDGSITVNADINLTNPSFAVTGSGTFNVPSGATLKLGHTDGITSTGSTGQIQTATRNFSTSANYSYEGTAAQNTGNGLPSTVNNLTITDTNNVYLTASTTVNGTLAVNAGDLYLNGNTVTLGPTATLAETDGNTVGGTPGSITTTRTLTAPSGNIGGMGISITSAADLGSTTITRGHSLQTNGTNFSIYRYFDVTPTNNTGLNATLAFKYDESELNSITEANLYLFKSTDGGTNWTGVLGTLDMASNTITVAGVDGLSRWTAADANAPLPVQLASFTGTIVNSRVKLDWTTISEVNNYGFFVQRRINGLVDWVEVENSFVAGHGTTTSQHHYTFTDNTLLTASTEYRLKQVDLDRTVHYSEPIRVDRPTSVSEVAPKQFTLSQNYPNPFNPTTTIKFTVEKTAHTTLSMFNMIGQQVATLFDATAEPGRYYSVKFDGKSLSSGLYFYKLVSGARSDIKKLVLTK